MVLAPGRSHQAAADLMATAVATVVRKIRQLGLEVALHMSEAMCFQGRGNAPPPEPGKDIFQGRSFESSHQAPRRLITALLWSYHQQPARLEMHQIKNNPISEREHMINEAMVRQNKHVFFADRLRESVYEHVTYNSKGKQQPLLAPRLFVIYDNVEASEPGDTSDYSAVLDAPFYKLRIEDGIDPDPRNNNRYQWPDKEKVTKAIGFGCLLVPIGQRIKRGLNPNQPLQWKLIFPAVERYLESCLAHSHIRCYLFTLALHKAFMENETAKIGLDASHIKNHLFWKCEDNYARWPEDQLGTVLLEFLKDLYRNLSKTIMPNYFIDSCNEIASIPDPLLREQQNSLAKIIESPVLHMLHALNKIKYTKREFYPKFQCKKLFQILTCKDPLRLINPNLPKVVTPSKYEDSSESETENGFWEAAKANDRDYKRRKAAHKKAEEKKKPKVPIREQKDAWKQYTIPQNMDPIRRRLVLEFFIPHFIAMARSSEKFEAIRQALIYLEHAQRLCILLSEEPGSDSTAKEYLRVIREKLVDCQRKLVQQSYLPQKPEINRNRKPQRHRKQRPKFEDIPDSSADSPGIPAFTFVDVHVENSTYDHMKLNVFTNGEESKL
ncbi:uncharacterized protein LOC111351635 [Spodoptera litura]|uniref:Uncharacterized protein LOC111351635 n=1 Tax=Spodoptera litura TaxID=69820 RepID=A0A9J7E036_SPOLT|nr:uncharacterized protein LOC111351635 [Spodoptera litura]